jgi:Cytochrome c oxidase subunit IIa family
MPDVTHYPGTRPPGEYVPDREHPRGTLAIVLVFGLLFALGWLAVYLFVFLQRGAPHS